jgi:hypothetical protein
MIASFYYLFRAAAGVLLYKTIGLYDIGTSYYCTCSALFMELNERVQSFHDNNTHQHCETDIRKFPF